MRKILLLALTAVSGIALTGCSSGVSYDGIEGYERVEGRETVRIGLECNYEPFNWSLPKAVGNALPIYGSKMYVDGYDVQIAKYLAKELEVNVELYMVEWDNLILELNAGSIDAIIAGMSPTAERKEVIDFTEAYYTSEFVFVMNKDSQYASATTFADLNGAKGCGQFDTLYDDLIQLLGDKDGEYADLNITAVSPDVDGVPSIALALSGSNCPYDFTIVEAPVAQALVKANDKLVIADITDTFDLSPEDTTVSIGVSKNDKTNLVSRINTALAKLTPAQRDAMMTGAVERSS